MLLNTPDAIIGWQAPAFSLDDPNGRSYSFHQLKGSNGIVVAFICNHCPYVKAIISRLVEDAGQLQDAGFGVVAINPNDYHTVAEDRPEKMIEFARMHGFNFPYLVDQDQSVARAYASVCTPDFFGFDAQDRLQYRGRLDDAKMQDASNRIPELVNAMQSVRQTGSAAAEQHASMGCSIKWL